MIAIFTRKQALPLVALFVLFSLFTATATAADDPVVTTKVEGEFHDVSNNIRMAITGKGINIDYGEQPLSAFDKSPLAFICPPRAGLGKSRVNNPSDNFVGRVF